MMILEFLQHPEWHKLNSDGSRWDSNGELMLIDDAPAEALKAFEEYKRVLDYEREHEIDF